MNNAHAADPITTPASGRMRLRDALARTRTLAETLDLDEVVATAGHLEDALDAREVRVLILGDAARGKTTLLNALLGREVLPASPVARAIAYEVRSGDGPVARLVPWGAGAGLSAARARELDPTHVGRALEQEGAAEAYERVEITWPLSFLAPSAVLSEEPAQGRDGLVDSTTLAGADAAIVVLRATMLGSQSELSLIRDRLIPAGFDDLIFVCTGMDQVRQGERDRLREYGVSLLGPLTTRDAAGVFFISAADALAAQDTGGEPEAGAGGLADLKAAISALTSEDPAARRERRVRAAARSLLGAVEQAIDERLAALDSRVSREPAPATGLDQQARGVERARTRVIDELRESVHATRGTVAQSTRGFLNDLAAQMPAWVSGRRIDPIRSVTVSLSARAGERAAEECARVLAGRAEAEFATWQGAELASLLRDRAQTLADLYAASVGDITRERRALERAVGGPARDNSGAHGWVAAEPFLAQLADLEGLGVGRPVRPRVVGARRLAPIALGGAAIGAVLIGPLGLAPLFVVPLVAGGAALAGWQSAQIDESGLQRRVALACAEQLRARAPALADSVAEAAVAAFEPMLREIDTRLRAEEDSVRQDVAAHVEERERDTAALVSTRDRLFALRSEAAAVSTALRQSA